MAEEKNFLSRWSQRKLERQRQEEGDREPDDGHEAAAGADAAAGDAGAGLATGEAFPEDPQAGEAERHPAEDIDIAALTKESDFTIFMQKGVPKEVKRQALRKLWTSDPLLANLDGLNDYEDMERVYGMGPIGATAWKIGRGFLTDEDLGLDKAKASEETAEVAEGEAPAEDAPEAQADDEAVAGDGTERTEMADAGGERPDDVSTPSGETGAQDDDPDDDPAGAPPGDRERQG